MNPAFGTKENGHYARRRDRPPYNPSMPITRLYRGIYTQLSAPQQSGSAL